MRGIVWQTSRLIDGGGSSDGAPASAARGGARGAPDGTGTFYRNHPGCRDTNRSRRSGRMTGATVAGWRRRVQQKAGSRRRTQKRIRLKFPYEWQIGWRYTRAGKRTTGNGFISFIALVSMSGIALGVAALIVVLSVMNGFQKEVRDRMLSVLAHVEIFSPTGSMPNWQLTAQEARQNKEVIGAAPYVDAQALLTRQDAVSGVALRGV
jgi:lipoprotein-releasing system permease protein